MGVEEIIYTVHHGCNSKLIKNAVTLYFKKGSRIADVTYGRGVFWKDIDKSQYEIVGTDIMMGVDFRQLSYQDNAFDNGAIDPPYTRNQGLQGMIDCYKVKEMTHNDIVHMYREGLSELKRTISNKGYILCKCQDEIYGGKQYWTHEEIKNIAEKELGMCAEDLFILVNTKRPKPVHKQKHARKNHSYLWVFQVNK